MMRKIVWVAGILVITAIAVLALMGAQTSVEQEGTIQDLLELLVTEEGESRLCLVGEGDLPLKEFLEVLKEGCYPGIYCLEWEKRWHPEIEDPEEAFPKYVERMKDWAAEIGLP